MTLHRTLRPALALLAVMSLGLARPAAADGGTKIAVANPSKILSGMQETADIKKTEDTDIQRLDAEGKAKGKEVQDLKEKREKFSATGTPDYEKATSELIQKSVDVKVWTEVQQAHLTQRNKEAMRSLFEKIEATIAQICEERHIDLVVTDFGGDIPKDLEQIPADRLRQIIAQKSVLFAGKGVDITEDVITRLNANYKAGAGAPSGK